MILQALKEYYDRKPDISPPGWEKKEIPYLIVLNKEGRPAGIQPTVSIIEKIEKRGKKDYVKKEKVSKFFIVPEAAKGRTSLAIRPNLFWDKPEYSLGIANKGTPERLEKLHQAFKQLILDLGNVDDPGLLALKKFLAIQEKEKLLAKFDEWENLLKEGANLTFKLAGEPGIITDSPAVRQLIDSISQQTSSIPPIRCLVTGELDTPVLLHKNIEGVRGTDKNQAPLICFNSDAYCSYGKKQGENSPVGKRAEFAYTTALNTMLAKGSKNRMQVGDATTIVWASEEMDFEGWFVAAFGESPKGNPDEGVEAVHAIYKSIETGVFHTDTNDGEPQRFYILGLSPNVKRISIRFWIADTVESIAKRVMSHFKSMEIVAPPNEPRHLPLSSLLLSTAVQKEKKNISPKLGGDVMRTILAGLPYPRSFLQAAVLRSKSENSVTYPRAAIIKACLISYGEKGIMTNLNKNNHNSGYLSGRLFAVLEKCQSEAQGDTNTTISNTSFAGAMTSPYKVFPSLVRLNVHHLSKIKKRKGKLAEYVRLETLLMEIKGKIGDSYPSFLSLTDQGLFDLGYYHQKQYFFTKEYQRTVSLYSDNSTDQSELRSMPYADYLNTEWWKGIREEALDRADRRCQVCNASEVQLDCHHRTYENRGCWKEVDDVIVLCSECHKKAPHDEIMNQEKTGQG